MLNTAEPCMLLGMRCPTDRDFDVKYVSRIITGL